MTTSTAITVAEHARELSAADRDAIVLSANELRDAFRLAVRYPDRAMTYLAEAEREGFEVNPRTRAKYLYASKLVVEEKLLPVYPDVKPEPIVTARTTTRVLPPIETDECGNRYLEAADGSYRFTFVENPASDEPYAGFKPRVIPDADDEMDEDAFQVFAADAARFAKAIKAPVASSWNTAAAS